MRATIWTMPTEQLLEMLPIATAELRVRIEEVLKARFKPLRAMPCIQIGR